jgi:hypothetical protein
MKEDSAENQRTEGEERAYDEYLGDLSRDHTTKMLTHLTNINNFQNSIHLARGQNLDVSLLQDKDGKFVGLLMTPEDSEYLSFVYVKRVTIIVDQLLNLLL